MSAPGYLEAAVIIDLVTAAGDVVFEPVLSYLGWWDCPRSGVALVLGEPYYFECQFSEELDDYPDQFRLWPIAGDELEDELEVWQLWAAWRDRRDSGLRPGPFPGDPVPAALERALRRRQRQPPKRRVWLAPSGALTGTARLPAASPCIWSDGRSLADARSTKCGMTGRANLRNRHGARSWEFVAYGPPMPNAIDVHAHRPARASLAWPSLSPESASCTETRGRAGRPGRARLGACRSLLS